MGSEKFWNSFAAGYDKQVLANYRQVYSTMELAKFVKRIYAVDTAEKMIEIKYACFHAKELTRRR